MGHAHASSFIVVRDQVQTQLPWLASTRCCRSRRRASAVGAMFARPATQLARFGPTAAVQVGGGCTTLVGSTPLDVARQLDHEEVARLLDRGSRLQRRARRLQARPGRRGAQTATKLEHE